MADDQGGRSSDGIAIIVLVVAVLLALAAWWLFPKAQQWIANQDCVASGRTNCTSQIQVAR